MLKIDDSTAPRSLKLAPPVGMSDLISTCVLFDLISTGPDSELMTLFGILDICMTKGLWKYG
jgi:hypothetical protein